MFAPRISTRLPTASRLVLRGERRSLASISEFSRVGNFQFSQERNGSFGPHADSVRPNIFNLVAVVQPESTLRGSAARLNYNIVLDPSGDDDDDGG